ncbi:MAG: spore coat protein [Clostridia bacterium]|nr:spore coat protein [Clostridia bacterium]MDD4048162.1 spore coat protein [Clostridia bacterium]
MPGESQTSGTQMNDRDRINDCLSSCKWLTDNFNIMAREASHQALHQDVMTILNETHKLNRDYYNLMFEQGHYELEAADEQKIQQTSQQFQNYAETQLNQQGQGIMQ